MREYVAKMGRTRNDLKFLIGKSTRVTSIRMPRSIWQSNIRVDLMKYALKY